MKLLFLFLLIFSSLNVLSNEFIDIDKIFIFNTKVWHEVESDSAINNSITIDEIDTKQVISILKRSKVKKYPIYKASKNSLYGIAIIRGKEYHIRISETIIFLTYGKSRHYFINKKEDLDWLNKFIIDYNKKLITK